MLPSLFLGVSAIIPCHGIRHIVPLRHSSTLKGSPVIDPEILKQLTGSPKLDFEKLTIAKDKQMASAYYNVKEFSRSLETIPEDGSLASKIKLLKDRLIANSSFFHNFSFSSKTPSATIK